MRSRTCSLVLFAATALSGCATFRPPPISYDDPPQPAVLELEPPKPVQVVEVPKLCSVHRKHDVTERKHMHTKLSIVHRAAYDLVLAHYKN